MSHDVVLAIETSQRMGGVALRDSKGEVHAITLQAKRGHDDQLLPAIDQLFRDAGLKPMQLHAVGVSIGPGGFTGLRIAVSTVKMFAEVFGATIVAVPSALVATELIPPCGSILVALAAKGNTVWVARLVSEACHWQILGREQLLTIDEIDLTDIHQLLGDEHLPLALSARCAAEDITVKPPRFEPLSCLALTLRMLSSGITTDPMHLKPQYARPPEAVRLWAQRPGSIT